MSGKLTFNMIKPSAVQSGYSGGILKMIEDGGFRIKALRMHHLTEDQAMNFYKVHAERPFYRDLVQFMSSGPVVAAILEKENAVASFRTLIGSTNPADAEPGTVRKAYGKSVQENAVHGSDSDENALVEAGFFFSETERF
ncbi:MAG: nucleoside-diphosphate kinase [Bacteroidales bacterium]|nr:nucleoside-diphosphate kinase [Bacteroidales bacterium]